mgnify:CR=1 FL=1
MIAASIAPGGRQLVAERASKQGRKEGRKEGRKQGSKEGRKEGRKEAGMDGATLLSLWKRNLHFILSQRPGWSVGEWRWKREEEEERRRRRRRRERDERDPKNIAKRMNCRRKVRSKLRKKKMGRRYR